MARFREQFDAQYFRLGDAIVDALLASYREWGGTASPPTVLIVDFRGVPTWSEFEILQNRFEGRGLPTVVADPRELVYEHGKLIADGRVIDLVYRRVLMNDILARREDCAPLLAGLRGSCGLRREHLPLQDPAQEGVLRRADRRCVPTTCSRRTNRRCSARTCRGRGWSRPAAPPSTAARSICSSTCERHRDEFVIKPNDEFGGAGVVLGWEKDEREWAAALDHAVASGAGAWVAQRRIPVSRQVFPTVETPHAVVMRDMLVDLAPYIFRGRVAGFLTRLSSTGLANVTSGGGQIPSFVVEPREG